MRITINYALQVATILLPVFAGSSISVLKDRIRIEAAGSHVGKLLSRAGVFPERQAGQPSGRRRCGA
ncbi:hypothetical protein EMIT0215P_10089 [Pseudomonas serboccidentalis]